MNKAGFELNELPELIEKGKLTRKEAINFIAEEIHRNPGLFLISKQNDEIKSELVFRFLKNGYFVFDHYKKEFGKFRNYLISYLRYQRLTIRSMKTYRTGLIRDCQNSTKKTVRKDTAGMNSPTKSYTTLPTFLTEQNAPLTKEKDASQKRRLFLIRQKTTLFLTISTNRIPEKEN